MWLSVIKLWVLVTACSGQVRFAPVASSAASLRHRPLSETPQARLDHGLSRSFLPVRAPSSPQQQQYQQQKPFGLPPHPPPPPRPTTFRPDNYRSTASPTPHQSRPVHASSLTNGLDRSQSRFQQSQHLSRPQFEDEDTETRPDYGDYEDEPDQLSLLLAESKFQCDASNTGYYADDSVDCKAFHYCSNGVKHSWVCPEGNIFHQINLICQPVSDENICQRSNDFHFVNDYLYQVVKNDSDRPEYADRFYPENYYPGSDARQSQQPQSSHTIPQAHRSQQQQQHQRPTRPVTPHFAAKPSPTFSSAGPGSNRDNDFRRPPTSQPSYGLNHLPPAPKPVLHRVPTSAAPDSSFRPSLATAGFDPGLVQHRLDIGNRRDAQPLPPVRPAVDPFPSGRPPNPDIRSHGAPIRIRRPQEKRKRPVLGGYQGNFDIHDLVPRNGQPRF